MNFLPYFLTVFVVFVTVFAVFVAVFAVFWVITASAAFGVKFQYIHYSRVFLVDLILDLDWLTEFKRFLCSSPIDCRQVWVLGQNRLCSVMY